MKGFLTRVVTAVRYFSRSAVREELARASLRLLSGGDAFAGHPS